MRVLFSILLTLICFSVSAQEKAITSNGGGAPGPASKIVFRSNPMALDTAGVVYLVDGVVRDYNFLLTIDPKMVQSISIIKNRNPAFSCAGTRATIHIKLKCKMETVPTL